MNSSAIIVFVNNVTMRFICENLLSHSLEDTGIMSGRYLSGNSLWTFFPASFSKNPWITHLLFSQNLLDKFLHDKMVYEHWSFLDTILDLVYWPNLVNKFNNYCTVSLWTLPKCFFVSKQNFFCKKLILLKGCIKLFRMTKSQRYFMENEFCFEDVLFTNRELWSHDDAKLLMQICSG